MVTIRWKNQTPPNLPNGGWEILRDSKWEPISKAEVRQYTDTHIVMWV